MAIAASTFDSLSGVSIKSFREVRTALAAAFKEVFADIDVSASSPDGMMIDLLAYIYVELSQSLQGALASLNRDTAEGVYLDSLAKIAGLTRAADETDASLRSRMQEASFTGLATFDSMLTYLRDCISPSLTMSENLDGRTFSVFVPSGFSTSDIDAKDADWLAIQADSREANVANYVAQKIWNCKPAGMKSLGTTVYGSAVDAAGNFHDVYFNYNSFIDFDVKVTISEYSEELLPADYASLITAAIASWATDEYSAGKDVIPKRMCAPIYSAVDGVDDVVIQVRRHGTSAWSESRLSVADSECARITASNIEVGM